MGNLLSQSPGLVENLSHDDILAFLPSIVVERANCIPKDVLDMPLKDLEKKVDPTIDLLRLRIAFWLEFERAYRTEMPFSLPAVYRGITNANYFHKCIITNSFTLTYLMTPPPSYSVRMEEMLHYGLELERDILGMPHLDPVTKRPDVPLLKTKLSIVEGVHNRLRGLPVSRSHVINQNLDKEGNPPESKPKSLMEIETRIKELEDKNKEKVIEGQHTDVLIIEGE